MPGTVTVACALPHGFIMQLQEPVVIPAPSRDDPSRKEQLNRFSGKAIRIAGPAPNRDPKRVLEGHAIPAQGAFALTYGVDKDVWDKWREQMKEWPPLVAGQVFAHENGAQAKDQARAGQVGPSGFEPYDPSRPPSEFAGRIKTAEKQ